MKRRVRIGLGVSCAVLVACSSTPRVQVSSVESPSASLSGPGGSVAVTLKSLYDMGGEETAFREGMGTYFDRHSPNWETVPAGSTHALALQCEEEREGLSNCSEMIYDCTLKHGARTVSTFTETLESDTCGKGGDVESYRAQSFNHALDIGKTVVETMDAYDGLQEAAAEQALAEARDKRGADALESVAERFDGTEAASTAREEATKRRADALFVEREAERIADERAQKIADAERAEAEAERAAAEAKAKAEAERVAQANRTLNALRASGDAALLDAFAEEYDDLDEQASTARELAASIRGDEPEEPEQTAKLEVSKPEPRNTSLSCYDARNMMCGDYDFPTVAKRNDFATKCRQLGSKVLTGKCDTDGAYGCKMSAAGGTSTTTWIFNLSRRQVQASCPTSVIDG